MAGENRAALLKPRAWHCLVLRFTSCPNAHPARCPHCNVIEQARVASVLVRDYCRGARRPGR